VIVFTEEKRSYDFIVLKTAPHVQFRAVFDGLKHSVGILGPPAHSIVSVDNTDDWGVCGRGHPQLTYIMLNDV